jgi:predicted secreted protein
MTKYTGNSLAVVVASTPVTANLIKSVEITSTADTYESTGAGDTAKTYLGGHTDASIKIDAWDDAAVANLRTIFAVGTLFSTTLHICPQGTGSHPNLTPVLAIVTGLTMGAAHDGAAPVSITLQSSGGISETNSD